MESVMEGIALVTMIVASAVTVIGAVWAVIDALATSSETFQQAERRKWAWVVSSLLIAWVGVYYLCVTRHVIKGTTFPTWVGHLATAFGSWMALVTFAAIAGEVGYEFQLVGSLMLPIAMSLYLGLNYEEWTDSAPVPARQRRLQMSPIAH